MSSNRGDYPVGSIVRLLFNSYNTAGALVTATGFTVSDIVVYKNGGGTERTSTAGYTASADFDTIPGMHMVSIDTSDNTDAGFYAAGNEYQVLVSGITVDSQTVGLWAGQFSIERAGGAIAMLKDPTTGLAAIKAYVDTEVAAVLAAVDTEIADIQSRLPAALVSGRIDASVGAVAAAAITAASIATDAIDADALSADALTEIFTKVWTTALTEAYSTLGGDITGAQALYELIQQRQEVDTGGGVTETVKKRDQSTTALTLTLNNAVVPTSITRAT